MGAIAALRRLEQGHAAEVAIWRGVPGMGLATSANQHVLRAAAHAYAVSGIVPSRLQVLRRAAAAERRRAGGRGVGGQDVGTVVHGGAVVVRSSADGRLDVEGLSCDEDWLGRHLLVAHDSTSGQHDVPALLNAMLNHASARTFVQQISTCAAAAAGGIQGHDLRAVAHAVEEYSALMNAWMEGAFITEGFVAAVAAVRAAVGANLLAAKPCGAGAVSSMVAIVEGGMLATAARVLADLGWAAEPVRIGHGLRIKRFGNWLRFQAGHRVDLVGAADLGVDAQIQEAGTCVALAVGPRSDIWVRRPVGP